MIHVKRIQTQILPFRSRSRLFIIGIIFSFTGIFFSCNNNIEPVPETSFEEVVSIAPDPLPVKEVFLEESIVKDSLIAGDVYCCNGKKITEIKGPEHYLSFNPSSSDIFPGNLLKYQSLVETNPSPIPLDRNSGVVSIDVINGSQNTRETVDEVSFSSIVQAQNKIIQANSGVVPANFKLNKFEVQSTEQMGMSIGVNVKTMTSEFKGKMAFSSDKNYNRYLIRLEQTYYTMHYDMPNSLADIFAPNVTSEDLKNHVQEDNPAVYIASVSYGRRFFLLLESTATKLEMEASIEGTYGNAIAGIGLEVGATYAKDLENSKITVFAQGGDAGLALSTFNGDYEAVKDFLTKGGGIDTGFPLSYTIRSVNTGRILDFEVKAEYEVHECSQAPALTTHWGGINQKLGGPVGAVANIGSPAEKKIAFFNEAGDQYVLSALSSTIQGTYELTGPFPLTNLHPDFPFTAVGAGGMYLESNVYRGAFFFDKAGLNTVLLNKDGTLSPQAKVENWATGNCPFNTVGIGAYANYQNTGFIVFDQTGENSSFYGTGPNTWDSPNKTMNFGKECPFDKIKAAVSLKVGNSYQVFFFDKTGTKYAFYSFDGEPFSSVYNMDK